jgi:hypothetical protein
MTAGCGQIIKNGFTEEKGDIKHPVGDLPDVPQGSVLSREQELEG